MMMHEERKMLRRQMHKELDVLVNKMFESFPDVDNFRISIDHITDSGANHISAIADSEVGIEGARVGRRFMYYETYQGDVVSDEETYIGDEYREPSRYEQHRSKGLCVRCDNVATKGIYCDRCYDYVKARYLKVNNK